MNVRHCSSLFTTHSYAMSISSSLSCSAARLPRLWFCCITPSIFRLRSHYCLCRKCRDAASPGALAATADATLFGRLWAQARERQAACTLDFSKCKLQILEVQPLHFRRPPRRPRSHKRRTPSKRPSTPQPTSYSSQSTVHPHALETFSYKLVATAAVSGNENYAVFGTFYGLPQPKRHWSELSHHG